MYYDITGIILAGGKSSRMGVNKSLLKLGEKTIIERIVDLMKSLFNKVIIITNKTNEYEFLKLPLHQDIYKEKGPLGGIHSGLVNSKTDKNFFISCDIPLMTKEMIEYIVNYKTKKPIIFCEAACYHQPLAGVYKKNVLPKIEEVLNGSKNANDNSLHLFLKRVDSEIVQPQNLEFYDDRIFFNVNNPDDYRYLLSL